LDKFYLNLVYIYHTIVASENLLVLAAAHTESESLMDYFFDHLEEERDHAKWLREDLLSVGVDPTTIPASHHIREMVGNIYYLIYHKDAAALLGYMRMLESWRMPPGHLDELKKVYPEKLLRTLIYHQENDPKHLEDILKIISTLTPEQQSLINQTEAESYLKVCAAAEEFNAPQPRAN
jgi:pyrroloquinoline quinone (PQQ) biosynthesis protein C